MAAREPRREEPGKCVFCGTTGLTKEHMWPDWLRAYIPRTANEHREGATIVHLDEEEETISRRTGDPHSRRIRCVCRTCNNGWMSRMQETTKQFLVPMLVGDSTSLDRRGQRAVSAWSAMLVMVAEHVQREMIAIPGADRARLRARQMAPPHWRIWIGRHSRREHPLFTHRVLSFVPREEFERLGGPAARVDSNTQTSTICLGKHLLIHVMSSDVAWSIVRRWRLRTEISAGLTQIWPTKTPTVSWPPSRALTDAGIDLVANVFFDKATALVRGRGA